MKGFNWVHVSVIGALLFLLVAGIGWFRLSPKQKQMAQLSRDIEQLKQAVAQRQQAEQQFEEARKHAADVKEKWLALKARFHVFSFPEEDSWKTFWKWLEEALVQYERQTRSYIAKRARECNVRLISYNLPTVQVRLTPPTPPSDGFMNLGNFNITVEGRYANILRFIERLPNGPRPILIGAPQFEGVSPRVRAVIPVTLFLICETAVERAALEGKVLPGAAPTAPTAPAKGAVTSAPPMPGAEGMMGQGMGPGGPPGGMGGAAGPPSSVMGGGPPGPMGGAGGPPSSVMGGGPSMPAGGPPSSTPSGQ